MIFFIIFNAELWKPKDRTQSILCIVDLAINCFVFGIRLVLQLVFIFLTSSFGVIFLLFLVPVIVDIVLLARSVRFAQIGGKEFTLDNQNMSDMSFDSMDSIDPL